jgi:zinc and cadmium transporter
MTLLYIVLATAAGGLLSVVVAASLTVGLLTRVVRSLVSLSAGVLLGTALLHLLPEAFARAAGHGDAHARGDPNGQPPSFAGQTHALHAQGIGEAGPGADPGSLFATLLGGLLFFWLLEKVELYRHAHHHEGDGHAHGRQFDAHQAGRGGFSVLVGDGVHNFCDGVIIAAAFLTDPTLGLVTTLAVAAHEIPQEAGDYIVLLNAGFSRARALAFNLLSGLAAVAGGVVGYFLVAPFEALLPYLLVAASSSFIYVAVADLLPQLQQRLAWRETLAQVFWLAAGLGIVLLARALLPGH